MPKIKFIILSTQRSGSTWLTDSLGSHHDVLTYTELFLRRGKGVPPWSRKQDIVYWNSFVENKNKILKTFLRPTIAWKYLNILYRKTDDNNCVGFKLMYDQLLHYPEILLYIIIKRIKIIHLYRDNVVATVISNCFREARQTAHITDDNDLQALRLKLDVDSVYKKITWNYKKIIIMNLFARFFPVPSISVSYESLLLNADIFQHIQKFLKVPSQEVTSRLKKINKNSLHKNISNIDALENRLRGTRYEKMLASLVNL